MLNLTRRKGEAITIDRDKRLTVAAIEPDRTVLFDLESQGYTESFYLKLNETRRIDSQVFIQNVKSKHNHCQQTSVGIHAPSQVPILRAELDRKTPRTGPPLRHRMVP